ncbi:hypothetical protein ACEWY4_017277 [Coilia grayii]|uniref:Ig-like domain-containing protein n=1 Tax=Coilia grayii TaxID=363190 RepID=A0ABD1JGE4_9TELE
MFIHLHTTGLQVGSSARGAAVKEEDDVTLTCKTTCSLAGSPSFIWSKDGRPVEKKQSTSNQLQLHAVSREDEGSYTCAVRGHEDLPSPPVRLKVHCKKDVTSNKDNVKEGDNVTLTCKTTCSLSASTSFIWSKDGRPVEKKKQSTSNQLQLHAVSRGDEGNYTCAVRGHEDLPSPPFRLNVHCLHTVQKDKDKVKEGDIVTLTCNTTCPLGGSTSFIWSKDGHPVEKKQSTNNQLQLHPITYRENGSYTCAVTGHERLPSPPLLLTFVCQTFVTLATDKVYEGDNVTLTCKTTCPLGGSTSFIWSKIGGPVKEKQNNQLQLQPVSREDNGSYTCAVRGHDASSEPFVLNVVAVPSISLPLLWAALCTAAYGNTVQLNSLHQSLNPNTTQPDADYQNMNPNTTQPDPVYQSLNPNTIQPDPIYQSLSPNTSHPDADYQNMNPNTTQPDPVYQSLNPNTIQPDPIYQSLSPNTSHPDAGLSPNTTHPDAVYQSLNPNTTQPDEVYQSLNSNTRQPDAVYQSLNPNTIQSDAVYQNMNPNTTQPDPVYQSLNPNTIQPDTIYQSLSPNTSHPDAGLSPNTTHPDAVYQSLNPNTTQPDEVYQSLNSNTRQPDAVYQSLNPNTIQSDAVYQNMNPNTTQPDPSTRAWIPNTTQPDAVYQSLNPNTTQPDAVYQGLNPNTTQPDAVYQSLNPNTTKPDPVYQSLNPNTRQPNAVYQSLNPNTIQPDAVYQSLNPNTIQTDPVYQSLNPNTPSLMQTNRT